jgi:hypothetical protein
LARAGITLDCLRFPVAHAIIDVLAADFRLRLGRGFLHHLAYSQGAESKPIETVRLAHQESIHEPVAA